jgi:hypothetical protein
MGATPTPLASGQVRHCVVQRNARIVFECFHKPCEMRRRIRMREELTHFHLVRCVGAQRGVLLCTCTFLNC